MIRIMRISAGLWCVVVAVGAGCRGKYERKELTDTSERVKEIRRMVRQLRSAEGGELDRVIASQTVQGMAEPRRRMADAALRKLAQAENAKIVLTDRYGDDVFRVSFDLTVSDGPESLTMLLVPDNENKLRWAGPN